MNHYYLAKVVFDDESFVFATAPLDHLLKVGDMVEVKVDNHLKHGTIKQLVYVFEDNDIFLFFRNNINIYKIVSLIVPILED